MQRRNPCFEGGVALRLRCYLREIRGRRSLRVIAAACDVNRGTLSMIEVGRSLPKDEWIVAMEQAYGAPFEDWYPPLTARALELDLEDAQ